MENQNMTAPEVQETNMEPKLQEVESPVSEKSAKPRFSKKTLIIAGVVTLLLITASAAAAFVLLNDNSDDNASDQSQEEPSDQDEKMEEEKTEDDEETGGKVELTKTCISENGNFKFMVPEAWTCENGNLFGGSFMHSVQSDYNNNLTITISDLGRGGYCTPPYEGETPDSIPSDPNCKTALFHENQDGSWTYYTDLNGGEIMGGYDANKIAIYGWMSIKYDGIAEDNKLSGVEEDTLIAVLDSFKTLGSEDPESNCYDEIVRIGINVPEGWTCQTGPSTRDSFAYTIKSNDSRGIEIALSNLGRGPMCGGEPDSECDETKPFYSSEQYKQLTLSRAGNQGEIIGGISFKDLPDDLGNPYVSITYTGIGTTDLNEADRTTVIRILESISYNI